MTEILKTSSRDLQIFCPNFSKIFQETKDLTKKKNNFLKNLGRASSRSPQISVKSHLSKVALNGKTTRTFFKKFVNTKVRSVSIVATKGLNRNNQIKLD